jgi:nitrite reductase (cytochrome c-552)
MKTNLNELITKRPWVGWVIFGITMLLVFFLGILASSIIQRRAEANLLNVPRYAIEEFEPRNEAWALAFPREYQTYSQMADTSFRSKYGGSAFRDLLEEDPRIVILFAGYLFSRDFNQARGHVYAIEDIHNTLRTGTPADETEGPQYASCWTCKSADVPRIMYSMDTKDFYSKTWANYLSEMVNPIGCANCHNPKDMTLRIFQIPLKEAFNRKGLDLSKSSLNEMRSLVCAQCHVEYYFKGPEKYVVFPWDKGMSVEEIENYYDEYEFYDWIHPLSKAPILKAQHPDYELFQHSIHYQRGVSCADCHMPYKTEGSMKISDHKVQSPLNNIENSCMVCHRQNKEELIRNVYDRQDKVYKQKIALEDILVKLHIEAKFAWEKGATEEMMKPVLNLIRQAQWRWDFVAASHGASFHAPLESMRILADGIDKASEARLIISRVLASLGYNETVPMPDISTKAKAQEYIGIDYNKLKTEKQEWKKNTLPKWLEAAKKREKEMPMPQRIL